MPGGIRTPDLVLRRHLLYPAELRTHDINALILYNAKKVKTKKQGM